MGFLNRDKNKEKAIPAKTIGIDVVGEIQDQEKEEEQEKYIWVKGYKGTNEKMQGFKNFQYTLNETYIHEGKLELCCSGFHFCRTLRDTFNYYDHQTYTNRYFEVEALVKEEDWSNENAAKYIAKKIRLIREIELDELYETYSERVKKLMSFEDFKLFKAGKNSFTIMLHDGAIKNLKDRYSEAFLTIVFNNCLNKQINNYSVAIPTILNTYDKAVAFADEGLSPDMRAYLLLK